MTNPEVFRELVRRELLLGNSVAMVRLEPKTWWDRLKKWCWKKTNWGWIKWASHSTVTPIDPDNYYYIFPEGGTERG